jgi:hypothetical protein
MIEIPLLIVEIPAGAVRTRPAITAGVIAR